MNVNAAGGIGVGRHIHRTYMRGDGVFGLGGTKKEAASERRLRVAARRDATELHSAQEPTSLMNCGVKCSGWRPDNSASCQFALD